MPKTINPEQLFMTYFQKNEVDRLNELDQQGELLQFRNQVTRHNFLYFSPLMLDRLREGLDIRAILLYWPPRWTPPQESDGKHLYYLYWCNGEDLDLVDQKVEQNTFSDEDFRYSVVTRNNSKTVCFECNSIWDTLVAESEWYGYKNGVSRVKSLLNPFECCPSCGKTFRIPVVKTFGLTPNQDELKRQLKLD